jgi:hypothetical protein
LSPDLLTNLALAGQICRSIPDQSLTMLDRGLLSYGLLHRLHAAGEERHRFTRPGRPGRSRFAESSARSSLRPPSRAGCVPPGPLARYTRPHAGNGCSRTGPCSCSDTSWRFIARRQGSRPAR